MSVVREKISWISHDYNIKMCKSVTSYLIRFLKSIGYIFSGPDLVGRDFALQLITAKSALVKLLILSCIPSSLKQAGGEECCRACLLLLVVL